MTKAYAKDGISFQFPENWELDEDPPSGVPRTISVTSEGGAFWAVTLYSSDESLKQLQHEYVETLEREYEDLELDDIEFDLADETILATDFQFYCLDFLVHSRLIVTNLDGYHVLITWQAEDREFDLLVPVFKALTFSLLHGSASVSTDS